MGIKRRLRKEYDRGYREGLYAVPMVIGPFFGTLQESGMIRDAYARGHKDGQQERKHRQEWHSRYNAASPNYRPDLPKPGEPELNLIEDRSTGKPLSREPQRRGVDPWQILEGPHD